MNGAVDAKAVQEAGPASQANAPPPNPFVGPVPLDVGQTLHGRRRETEELSDLLVSKRIVLLFSPSGAGKTSLIRAGLIPKLEDAYDMEALPIVRLGHRDLECDNNPSINRYRLATLYALEKLRGEDQRRQARDLCGYTLRQYFDECVSVALGRDAAGEPHYPLLILDQFEELFVADPLDADRKREYLDELGDLLRGATPGRWGSEAGAQIWALFAIREDRLAELQPYLDLIPTALSFRYRLDALGVEAAREAIGETAGAQWMAEDVPPRLVEDLCQVSVRGADGRDTLQPGRFVEPVQLQVVCRRLWTKVVLRQRRRIEASDVTARGLSEVDSALREFFDDEISAAAEEAGVSERKLRGWIETELISPSGVRTQALRDRSQLGQTDDAITRLVDAHLLRSDTRAGRDWIELPHDRLVAPVRASNKAWEDAHLQPFQVRSRLWHEASGEYARHLLLPAEELTPAKQYATDHAGDVTDEEREFLDACTEEVARTQRERRERNRLRGMIWGCVALVALVLVSWLMVERSQRAQADQRAQLYRSLGAARDLGSAGASLNALLPLRDKAVEVDPDGTLPRVVDNAIRQQLTRAPAALVQELPPRNHIVWSLAFTQDGKRLLAGSWDGHISVYSVATPRLPAHETPDLLTETYAVVVHGDLVATTHWDGRVLLWRLVGDELRQMAVLVPVPNPGRLPTADFSADGRWLAVAGWGKKVELWDLANPDAPIHAASFGKGTAPIQSIAFLPDRDGTPMHRLASTDYDGNVWVWDVGAGMPQRPTPVQAFSVFDHEGHKVGISASAADPNGRYFVAGDTEGALHVWDLTSTDRTRNGIRLDRASHRGPLEPHVKGIAFAREPNEFVSVGVDGYLVRWKLPADAVDMQDLNRRTTAQRFRIGERLFSVAYRPDARAQVAIGGTRSILLLDLDAGPGPALSKPLPASMGSTAWVGLAMNDDGTRIAARSQGGPIRLWQRGRDGVIRQVPQWALAESGGLAFALSPDGQRLVTVDCQGLPAEWSLPTAARPQRLQSFDPADCRRRSAVTPVFSPKGNFLATADGSVLRVWSRERDGGLWRALVATTLLRRVGDKSIARSDDPIASMAFSPDSTRLAVGAGSGGIRLWNLSDAKPDRFAPVAYVDVGRRVGSLTFRPDGNSLRAGGDDGFLTECSVPGLKIGEVLGRHERAITGAVLAPPAAHSKRDILISADADGNLLEWTLPGKDGKDRIQTVELAGRGSPPIDAVALSRDGSFLVTAGANLLAWDVTPANAIATAKNYASRSYVKPKPGKDGASGDEATAP